MATFVLWLHVVAAAVWLGGLVFIAAVLAPVLRSPELAAHSAALMRTAGRRFRTIGWMALVTLIVTGLWNLVHWGVTPGALLRSDTWASTFGQVLGVKLVLVALVLCASVIHDFSVGPRAGQAAAADPRSPEASRLRRAAQWLGRFNLLASLLIVALGLLLTRSSGW